MAHWGDVQLDITPPTQKNPKNFQNIFAKTKIYDIVIKKHKKGGNKK